MEHIPSRSSRKIRFFMQISCIFLLANDIFAWIFRGQTGTIAYYAVRISNFGVFFINFIYMSLFAIYLWQSISISSKTLPKRIFCIFGLSFCGIFTLILSQFTHLFYYFDQQNYYHRSSFYFLDYLLIRAFSSHLIYTLHHCTEILANKFYTRYEIFLLLISINIFLIWLAFISTSHVIA